VLGALDKAGMQGQYHTGEETLKPLEAETAAVKKVADRIGPR